MEKNIFDLKRYKLDNGIEIVIINKDTQLASIHVGTHIGTIYEKKEEKGIAHFVEHMLFKGTKKRTNEELNEELEQLGGEYNAYTDYNCTVCSITALKEELEVSIDLLSDMIQNSTFLEEEIERERGVILSELRTGNDDIENYSFKKALEYAFKESSIKIDTIGKQDTVEKFNREQLMNFYKQYYVPNNCCITVVSPYEHYKVFEMIKKYFKDWKMGEFKRGEVKVENNIPVKKISYKKDLEQSTIVYIYTFHNLNKQEELVLRVLNYKFGESANSILFRRLREEKGLAYDIYSELDMSKYVKTISIYTSVNEEDVEEALSIIDLSIEDIKNEKIVFNEKNIALMKKVFKTAIANTLEDSTQLANYAFHQLIDGEDIYEFIDNMNNMEKITSKDIYHICRKIFKNPTIHVLVPGKVIRSEKNNN
ncbi:pitrilysin family protein [Clostridium aestuarii]|uniref:Pitrilysin family protein n=1 Tax=Clostridium aestuarii TaxID=338193 RepID=A0ABT4CV34_9CLOT|nr:pitrilysin family protein [Clostridium aestuarii]MCY6482833.1 pitrilysin family protein [Clostridium aestuarii]